ncbi:unnamed protein product [Angiostrongylus costaricensis]|uniref:G_PROTEIN_RECEP_F1_2 domain-containing protein n=1 Tax=Angiostrongylus costaricensis TaxID=334426 RepID=A0A158PDQ4_ANGCS|nr:unnamed protein product [Angiostrongylus costaricensis]
MTFLSISRTMDLTIDLLIFSGLESLGVLAIIGNISLIYVLIRIKYLNRASFILIFNLAVADVMHGIVTTCYFYPPIILKRIHVGELIVRLFNIVDWTAWAITLTHMSAICVDRLIAIMLFDRYSLLITTPRMRNYSIICWIIFLGANMTFFTLDQCCMIRPLKSQSYYSFGYLEKVLNVYIITYTPLEIITIIILSISNPTTLIQLYRRHRRKIAMNHSDFVVDTVLCSFEYYSYTSFRVSTMLLEMSMRISSKSFAVSQVAELSSRRAARQQQRILLQVSRNTTLLDAVHFFLTFSSVGNSDICGCYYILRVHDRLLRFLLQSIFSFLGCNGVQQFFLFYNAHDKSCYILLLQQRDEGSTEVVF